MRARLLTGFLIALFMAAITVLATTRHVYAATGCHPAACHNWDPTDLWWWVFNCGSDHCQECGMSASVVAFVIEN